MTYNAENAILKQLTNKLITNYENSEYILREPGEGAIEFARRYIKPGMDMEMALDMLTEVIDGYVREVFDEKVKRCSYCGFLYRDVTKNNGSKVCSNKCKAKKDSASKKKKRKDTAMNNGTARKYADNLYYYAHLEYPYWNSIDGRKSEDLMSMFDRKRGSILLGDNFENVVASHKKRQQEGGKRKNTDNTNLYESKWSNSVWKPSAEFWGDTKPDASRVKIIKRSREEIEAYMFEKYGETKMAGVRKRAIAYAKGRR